MKLKLFDKFRKDEDGGILAFYLIMFITMMIGGGMAVDFMNNEYQREKLQDALDRGVLAAAAIGQAARAVSAAEITAAETQSVLVVKSYLEKSGFDPESPSVTITPDFTMNSQRMDAVADYEVDTFFLRLSGIDTLGGTSAAGAMVTQNNIEISLVLDVSGSMTGTKIAALQVAAKQFVDLMLAGDRSDYTFINLIPFDHSVNIGNNYMNRFAQTQMWQIHDACTYFTGTTVYDTPAISPTTGMVQLAHLNSSDQALCEDDRNQSIFYSNDADVLKNAIDGLEAFGSTAGFVGIKWGMGLLDPSAQPIVTSLIADGELPATMNGKPAAFGDDETLKFIIFMSDGAMNQPLDIPDVNYAVSVDGDGNLLPARSSVNADYWNINPEGLGMWDLGLVGPITGTPTGSAALSTSCDTAKAPGTDIVVFAVAYGLTLGSAADTALSDCSSGGGFYYNVDTADISAAFSSIAATIQQLKLVN